MERLATYVAILTAPLMRRSTRNRSYINYSYLTAYSHRLYRVYIIYGIAIYGDKKFQ